MSILSNIEAIWQKDETWIMNFILEVKQGAKVIETDLKAFWTWLAAHAGEITQDAQAVAGAVNTLNAAGIVIPSSVGTAVNAMNVAVAALNGAVTAAAVPNANTVNVLVSAYSAAKSAEAAHAQAASAIISTPVPDQPQTAPTAG